MNFQYPIRKTEQSSYTADELLALLAKENTGHYLLGNHNFWHGGVHFSNNPETFKNNENQPIHCIADGEIIAYRINDKHLTSYFLPNLNMCPADETKASPAAEPLKYSSSFCLVKHQYISPPEPDKEPIAPVISPKSQWVGRTIIFEDNRNVRNPNATKDDKTCTFKATIQRGSKAKIIEINDNYVKAIITYLVSVPDANGKTKRIYSLQNTRTEKTADPAKNIGGEIYFLGFNGESIYQNNGKDIFADDIAIDWTNKYITLQANTMGYVDAENLVVMIPKDTQLEVITINPVPKDGGIYATILSTAPLSAIKTQLETETCVEEPFPANKEMEIRLTDEYGNVNTLTNDNNEQYDLFIDSTPKPEPKTNKLTFYSLYMHLLPYDEAKVLNESPVQGTYVKLTSPVTGRASASTKAANLGAFAIGTVFEVLETSPSTAANGYPFARGRLYLNADGTEGDGKEVWFATGQNNAKGTALAKEYTTNYIPEIKNNAPLYWYDKAIIRATSRSELSALSRALQSTPQGENHYLYKFAQMNTGCVFEYDNTQIISQIIQPNRNDIDQQIKVKPIVECTFISGTCGGQYQLKEGDKFWLVMDKQTLQAFNQNPTPKKYNSTEPCNPPIPIKVGSPLGYMGLYQTPISPYGGVNTKKQLHFEIFTNETPEKINSFLNNEAGLTIGKKFLKIKKGATIYTAGKPDDIQNYRPYCSNPSSVQIALQNKTRAEKIIVAFDQVITLKEVEPTLTKDKNGIEWYKVSVLEQRQSTSGWIEKDSCHLELLSQHDWKKLGFTIIEERCDNSDGMVTDTLPCCDATVDSKLVYADAEDQQQATVFFQEIYNEIDKIGNSDGVVTPDEVKDVLTHPILAERIKKIIGYHPTEWYGKPDNPKWNALKEELSAEEDQNILKHELDRINELVFWDDVQELKNSLKIYHFHPIAFIQYINMAVTTYHIYHDGRIDKVIPFTLDDEDKNKYGYIYHDSDKYIHYLGKYEYIKIENKYLNRTGQRYGSTEFIHLISLQNVIQKYAKYNLKYCFNVDTVHKRFYMNNDTLASFFGALLDVSYEDISCNGFSRADGTSSPSVSHLNGYHGDFKYLRKDKVLYYGAGTSLNIRSNPQLLDIERQNNWNDALYKFGWKGMLGWSYTINGVKHYPNHITKETEDHDHHLHVENYDMKKIKVITE